MKQFPEGDIHKLCDQLKVVDTLREKEPKDNCMSCGKQGHTTPNCWGKCPACGGSDHMAGQCQLSPEKAKIKARNKKRRTNYKLCRMIKSKLNNESNPPEEQSNSSYWAESLSDGETVVDLDK